MAYEDVRLTTVVDKFAAIVVNASVITMPTRVFQRDTVTSAVFADASLSLRVVTEAH